MTVAAVAQFYSYGGWYASGTCNVSTTQLVDNLGIFRSFGDTFFSDQGGTTTTAQALTSENGATTTIIGSNFLMNQGASSNAIGNNGTATVFVQSSKVIANNGAIFGNWIDGGQNVFGGGSVSASFGSASITGTACATGNWALTSGWGTSSIASVTAGGDSHRCQVVITGAAGSASPVLTWTFPTAYKNAPGSCMLTGYPGVAANLTGVSTGAPGATNVAFTFTGTPVAQTYRFDVACGP